MREELLIALASPGLEGGDLGLLFLDDRVEGVDHLLRIEQRIEPIVRAQLEQLVKLAPRAVRFVLVKVGHAEHAVRLDDLALAVEQHLRIEQGVEDLDGALVLRAAEGGPPAIEGLAGRGVGGRLPRRRRGKERARQRGQKAERHPPRPSLGDHLLAVIWRRSPAFRRAASRRGGCARRREPGSSRSRTPRRCRPRPRSLCWRRRR